MSVNNYLYGPKNPDEVSLAPCGSVWSRREVLEPFGQWVDGFRTTVFELQILADYWYRRYWETYLIFIYEGFESDYEVYLEPYRENRLEQIRVAINEVAFQEVVDKVVAEVRKRIGEEDWAVITGHDNAALERLRNRSQSERDRSNGSGPAPSEPPSEDKF